ncbi:MlaC/ttg2D family ABC transporter substrate-binding protein [Thalassovita sp.]|uniref:MlaC/ttg2D family ABC transporter substrate-binding protein n=1 Tax=Thalassovita sp. TaxID=1979401 RepID=UPI003B5B252C
MSRRFFLTSSAATLLVPTSALALNDGQARRLVDGLVGEINTVIDSGKTESAMYKEFERIFRKFADLPYIAAYALGVDGRRATGTQKKAFTNAFTGYVSRKYGKRFREFIGGRLEVQGVKQVKSFYQVRTIAHLRGEAPFEVDFHVSDRSGKDLFFNMYIEGINMLLTEREEIGAMLDRRKGNIDALIRDLKTAG